MRIGPGRELDHETRDGRRGPSVRALVILAITALALIATTPAPPSLESRVIGEVQISGGESIERELRIHVDPAAGSATSGSISVYFQAASGLDSGDTRDVTLALVSASDSDGSFAPSYTFPLERCLNGCDLTYRVGLLADPALLPGSLIRYEVRVYLSYAGYGSLDQTQLRVDLEGQTTAPPPAIWSLLAGVLALLGGIAVGPVVDRALGPKRRRWPAFALVGFALGLIGWMVVTGIINLANLDSRFELPLSPRLLLFVVDPWSVALHGTLAWGVWRGIRRWPADGGWLLGLAAVATVGLDGLWLAYWLTAVPAVQPLLHPIPFVALGALGGIVMSQAWRTMEMATSDRPWAALAVISHGVVIAGFGFLAEQALYDPFSRSPVSFLTLIPAALVFLAFRRWLGGRRPWLILFDTLIALVGLLGLTFWLSPQPIGLSNDPTRFEIDDVAVYLAVGAAVVAFITSLHRMHPRLRPQPPGEPAADPIAAVSPPTPLVDDRPTT